MGKRSTEIQHDIERQRQFMTARISRLRERVQDDATETKDRITSRISGAAETVSSKATTTQGSDTAIASHPGALMAGSTAAGAVVGFVLGKGEQSGHVLKVRELLVDCDADTVLIRAEAVGPGVCHEGYRSCFFRRLGADDSAEIVSPRMFDPATVYSSGGAASTAPTRQEGKKP